MAELRDTAAWGLDTSVVVRLLVGEPVHQADAALRFLHEARAHGRPVWVSDLVASEAYFAMHTHYSIPKRQALLALLELLESRLVSPEPNGSAAKVLQETIRESRKLGFLDRLIHAQYERRPALLVSFERAALRLPHTKLLKG